MLAKTPTELTRTVESFIELVGKRAWAGRLGEIERAAAVGQRAGKAVLQHYALECAIERLRRQAVPPGRAEQAVAVMLGEALGAYAELSKKGRRQFREFLRTGSAGKATLIPLFHLLRCAATQRNRGFNVHFAGLEDAAPFDLLLERGGAEAEQVCEVVSAEEGRSVHRGAWFELADRIDPDLQTWLAAHPGRYLLKITLPDGLRRGPEAHDLARLHERVRRLLSESRRSDHDEALVLRLDPLLLAGAQAPELGLMSSLRQEFGPGAHLAVVADSGGVFAVAARAGREDDVAAAVRRRMAAAAPARLTGERPGILSMFVDGVERPEWRELRERLQLEGEARQFLTTPQAKPVVAVSVASRFELYGSPEPDGAAEGELRFRNPSHPSARVPALAPAVVSSG